MSVLACKVTYLLNRVNVAKQNKIKWLIECSEATS